MTTAAGRKFFTVEKANLALPLVRVIVEDIVELAVQLDERRERLRSASHVHGSSRRNAASNLYTEEVEQAEEEMSRDEDRLSGFEAELEALGVELKDRRVGVVDFPSAVESGAREGHPICLCWKLGETQVGHWHEVDDLDESRRPLTELTSERSQVVASDESEETLD
jgi:hypothetical protein